MRPRPRARRWLFGATTIALGALACGRSPVGPTARPESGVPIANMVRLTGHVLDGSDRAVAKARITLENNLGEVLESVTDANGFYTLTFDPAKGLMKGEVKKDGFERARCLWA
jgi:Carboxypeptidase regulatory-like domain